jgi:hypothetical protein
LGIPVRFKGEKPSVRIPGQCYEFGPVITDQKPKMAEEMRAQIEASKRPVMYDVMLAVVDQAKRYTLHVQMQANVNWDDLIQGWHAVAATEGLDGYERFPRIASGYEFKDCNGRLITKLEDPARIFASPLAPIPPIAAAAPPHQAGSEVHITECEDDGTSN